MNARTAKEMAEIYEKLEKLKAMSMSYDATFELDSILLQMKLAISLDPLNDFAERVGGRGDIRSVYRELAKAYHPDNGGTKEAMQAINEFYTRIK
jgi:hypothetical protein